MIIRAHSTTTDAKDDTVGRRISAQTLELCVYAFLEQTRANAIRSTVMEWPAKAVRQDLGMTSTDFILNRRGHSVEVVKGGQVAEKLLLEEKPFFLFGRQTDSGLALHLASPRITHKCVRIDVVVDHPSLSRHHCVIQFSKDCDDAFLCDLGSTHGTFLNKEKLAAHEHRSLSLDLLSTGRRHHIRCITV